MRICNSFLSYEEFRLTEGIKDRARGLVQSDGEYPAAATTLLVRCYKLYQNVPYQILLIIV